MNATSTMYNHIQATMRCAVIFVILLATFALEVRAQEPHATGINNGVVYLNDLENHKWTYYSGVDESVDGGNYNSNYKNKI